jgi:hypothetical protein
MTEIGAFFLALLPKQARWQVCPSIAFSRLPEMDGLKLTL